MKKTVARSQKHVPPRAAPQPEASLNDLPRWLPPTIYALVSIILFREFVLSDGKLLGTDTLALGYFARSFYTEFLQTLHRFPLWDPLLYGGLPFVEGMHGDIFYPPSLAMFLLNADQMWGWKMVLHVFLAGVFTYLWLRELGLTRGSAFLGGLIYMMGADLVSLVFPGGDGKLFVSTLAPLAFWLTERVAARRRLRDYAAFALGIALMVFTSHMQAAYFAIWGVSLYFIFRLVQVWRTDKNSMAAVGHLGAFALAGVIGVGAAAVQFIPPLGYLREWSHRADKTVSAEEQTAYTYSTQWSLHPEEVMSLVVPEFVGDNVPTEARSGATYWGRNFFKYNHEYAGLIPLLLLPLLFVRRRRALAWFFTALIFLVLTYGLGANTPFFRLYYLIPGVQLFRAPGIIIFLYGLSIATLGALAFERAVEWGRGGRGAGATRTKSESSEDTRGVRRALWVTTGVLALLAVLASTGVLTSMWRSVFYTAITPDKMAALATHLPTIRAGFWIAVAIALVLALAWEGYARAMYDARSLLVVVAVLVFLDLYRVDRPFVRGTVLMNAQEDPTLFTPDETVQFLRARQNAGEVFRVLDLGVYSQPNALAIHGIEQLAGHHGNELGNYRELIGGDSPQNINRYGLSLLDATNTAYLVAPMAAGIPGFTEVFRGTRSVVYRKDEVLPRAYLVGSLQVVPEDSAVARMLTGAVDLSRTAVVSELPAGITMQPNPQGSVQWRERGANAQRLSVQTDRPALLVVLDNYYEAWHAEVDGRETPILRVNHTFRGVPVPAGQHEVVFRYGTATLSASAAASAIILIVLMLAAFGPGISERIRRRRTTPA